MARPVTRARGGAAALAVLVALVSVVVLVGWVLQVPCLTTIAPGLASMKASTALSLGGLAITVLLQLGPDRRWRRVAIGVLVVGGAVVAAATIVEYLAGRSFGFDNLLGLDPGTSVGEDYPGRMSGATAAGLLLLWSASGLLLAGRVAWSQVCALVCLTLAVTTLVGYLYGATSLYQFGPFRTVALHTATGLLMLGVALLLLRSTEGFMGLLTGGSAGGEVARRLLPVAIVTPVVAGVVVVRGIAADLYDGREAVALVVTAGALAGAVLVWLQARRLRNVDRRRAGAEQAQAVAQAALAARDAMEADLRRANSDLADFSAAMAHDLRTPLTVIKGYAELLESVVPADGGRWLTRIQSAADRGADLIAAILTFSQIGSHRLVDERVDLAALVAAVREESLELARRPAQITIAALPAVRGDEALIRLLFGNLVGNALKYVPADREAIVRIDAVTRPRAAAGSGEDQRARVAVRVSDNGDPIVGADRERIFEMFQRGSVVGSTAGSGVGLAMCRRVVELHHGDLWLEDSDLGGSAFCTSWALDALSTRRG